MKTNNLNDIEKKEIIAEVSKVMTQFWALFKSKFMKNEESYYELTQKNGLDPTTFRGNMEDCESCNIRTLVQAVKPFECTVEIRIVPLEKNTDEKPAKKK